MSVGGAGLQWPAHTFLPSFPPSYLRGVVQVQSLLHNFIFLYGIYGILISLICPQYCASLSFPSQCQLLNVLLLDQKTCSRNK